MQTEWLGRVALALVASGLMWHLVQRLHARFGWQRPNFRGEVVPARSGLFPLMVGLIAVLLLSDEVSLPWLLALGYGVLGFIDDQWGQHAPKGVRGHLRMWLAGRPTTGLIKAIGGLALGVAIGLQLHHLSLFALPALLTGLMIALWANFFNLLDARPGRAGTLFLLLALPCIVALWWHGERTDALILLSLALGVLMVLPLDRAGKGMLGDTGSNLLGGVLGLSLARVLPMGVQALSVMALLLFHLWAERCSLSEWIERRPLLRRLDRLTGVR